MDGWMGLGMGSDVTGFWEGWGGEERRRRTRGERAGGLESNYMNLTRWLWVDKSFCR